jgi:hypothetical protein
MATIQSEFHLPPRPHRTPLMPQRIPRLIFQTGASHHSSLASHAQYMAGWIRWNPECELALAHTVATEATAIMPCLTHCALARNTVILLRYVSLLQRHEC